MKKRLAMILALMMASTALMAGCGGQEESAGSSEDSGSASEETATFEEKQEGDTFTVGFDQNFPPMGFVGDDGEYTGFDLELAQEVCDRQGWEFVAQPIAWETKDATLNSGEIDCIWNGFTMTGREDDYTWSEPYLDNQQVFVVRADSGIESLDDLAGKIVDVQTESSAQAALEENAELAGTFGNLQVVPDYDTGFMDLESGAVDAVAMDIVVASYQIESRNADFTILDESIATEEYGIGFAKGNEALRDTVQQTLEEMAEDGTMAEISTKWFGEDITTIRKIIKKVLESGAVHPGRPFCTGKRNRYGNFGYAWQTGGRNVGVRGDFCSDARVFSAAGAFGFLWQNVKEYCDPHHRKGVYFNHARYASDAAADRN